MSSDDEEATVSTRRTKRRKLPGCFCPQCGAISRAIHLRYNDHGRELKIPVRTFRCPKCKPSRKRNDHFLFQREATDLVPTVGVDSKR